MISNSEIIALETILEIAKIMNEPIIGIRSYEYKYTQIAKIINKALKEIERSK